MTSTSHINEDMSYQLGTISGKLDLILVHNADTDRRNQERFAQLDARADGQEERLDTLEKNQARAIGAGTALMGLFGAITTILGLRS